MNTLMIVVDILGAAGWLIAMRGLERKKRWVSALACLAPAAYLIWCLANRLEQ